LATPHLPLGFLLLSRKVSAMTKFRKNANITAADVIRAADALYDAADAVDKVQALVNGKAFTPFLGALIKEERRLQDMAFELEADWLRLATKETGDRLPPLLGSRSNVKAARQWAVEKGIL